MLNKMKPLIIVAALFFIASCSATRPEAIHKETVYYYQASTDKPYDDVLAELEVAIAEHNFRITGHSRVGKVIRDRGAQNFPEYDTVQFCNLSHAKILLELDPHAVHYMPCNVVVYQFKNRTLIKTHLLPENTVNPKFNQFAHKMNLKLKAIVDFAAEE